MTELLIEDIAPEDTSVEEESKESADVLVLSSWRPPCLSNVKQGSGAHMTVSVGTQGEE